MGRARTDRANIFVNDATQYSIYPARNESIYPLVPSTLDPRSAKVTPNSSDTRFLRPYMIGHP